MTAISVDPAALRTLSGRLGDAVAVGEVGHERGRLEAHLDGEHPAVQHAARSFFDRWAYVADASELSSRLDRASQCYVEVDESAARAFPP